MLLKQSNIVWQKVPASGSLLKVSGLHSRTYCHALHKRSSEVLRLHPSEAIERLSLIFRVIKTCTPIGPVTAAQVNSSRYRFLSKAHT